MKTINEYCKQVSTITEYLSTKVDATKADYRFPFDFCLVVAYAEMFRKMCKEWEDALMRNKTGPDVFVVPTSAVKEYFDNDNFEAYKIPDKYDNMNDLEEDLDNGRFDSKEIERLN